MSPSQMNSACNNPSSSTLLQNRSMVHLNSNIVSLVYCKVRATNFGVGKTSNLEWKVKRLCTLLQIYTLVLTLPWSPPFCKSYLFTSSQKNVQPSRLISVNIPKVKHNPPIPSLLLQRLSLNILCPRHLLPRVTLLWKPLSRN